MANKQDKRIDLNRDDVLSFVALDNDGDPIDLTECTIQWGFAASAVADEALVTFLSSDEGTRITIDEDTLSGRFTVRISSEDDFGDVEPGVYYHEATVTISDRTMQGVYGVLEIAATLLDPPA